ncbi:hypothetical protein [Pedobacter cryoconitis]|uniref:Uncharacterized protein n=1 Tax=Pedobacter cryoconitis TaxID=188932 RepID=A0A327SKI1_9SPHI|nr:hypothetical protein [Pedobacter cryoconitis]RAJ29248.1 hypothetical protein LY11_02953 [Pedobacter cryoconitis]
MENSNPIQSVQISDSTIIADVPPTIPLSVAIARASSWRKMITSLPEESKLPYTNAACDSVAPLIPSQLIFRAININMRDIDLLKQEHPDASSVRLYMSIPDPDFPFQICGMLVPVDAQNNDMLTRSGDANTSKEDMLNNEAYSTVYDFTQPCPTLCNTTSPLFDELNSVEPYLRYTTS